MRAKHKAPAEYQAFSDLLRRVVRVPHSEIKAKLDAEKAAKQKSKRASASGRASREKD